MYYTKRELPFETYAEYTHIYIHIVNKKKEKKKGALWLPPLNQLVQVYVDHAATESLAGVDLQSAHSQEPAADRAGKLISLVQGRFPGHFPTSTV